MPVGRRHGTKASAEGGGGGGGGGWGKGSWHGEGSSGAMTALMELPSTIVLTIVSALCHCTVLSLHPLRYYVAILYCGTFAATLYCDTVLRYYGVILYCDTVLSAYTVPVQHCFFQHFVSPTKADS